MKFSNKILFIFILLFSFFCSCRKQIPDCSGNCSNIVFEGFVYDGSLNAPLPGQSVTITLYQSGNCWICSSKTIDSGRSNASGHFSITTTLDTSLLKDYHLQVSVTATENFITSAEPVGPGISNSKNGFSAIQFVNVDTNMFKSLRFNFYPKALLKINLHRTSAITPQYPTLIQTYVFDDRTSVWGLDERPANADTALTIYTSANIFTKIVSSKQQSSTVVNTRTDSIKCSATTNNSIDINY